MTFRQIGPRALGSLAVVVASLWAVPACMSRITSPGITNVPRCPPPSGASVASSA